jgi:hypothetical protein
LWIAECGIKKGGSTGEGGAEGGIYRLRIFDFRFGIEKILREGFGLRKLEVGSAVVIKERNYGAASKQPPASPSCRLYESEAVGAIGAYAPEGRWKKRWVCGRFTKKNEHPPATPNN